MVQRPRSLLTQFLIPTVAVLVTTGVVVPGIQAMLAVRAQGARELAQLRAIAQGLEGIRFPYNEAVVRRLKSLTGADFVVVRPDGTVSLGTLRLERLPVDSLPDLRGVQALPDLPVLTIQDRNFLAAVLVSTASEASEEQLVVLYPQSEWRQIRWEAARVPLLLGGTVAVAAGAWVLWHAWRLSVALRSLRSAVKSLPETLRSSAHPQHGTPAVSSEVDQLQWVIEEAAGELRRMEQEITTRERQQMISQLGAGLAHHVRNTLAAARLILRLHTDECPAGADDLRRALQDLELAEYQLRGFLYLARGTDDLADACPLAQAIQDAACLVENRCLHHQIQLHLPAVPPDLVVRGAPEAVKTALLSVLLNAIEAVEPGRGRIAIRVTRTPNQTAIVVEDNGPGVPEEVQGRLFMPGTSTKPGGLGLGLAIARQICETCGGTVEYRRSDGRTEFVLRFPLAPSTPPPRSSSKDQRRQ